MSAPTPSNNASESSNVRLTLRGMFVIMLMVGLMAGVTGVVVRQQRTVEPLQLSAFWFGVVSGIVTGTCLAVWRRLRIERLAGRLVAPGRLTFVPWPKLQRLLEVPFSLLGALYVLAITIGVSAGFASGVLGSTVWIPFVAGWLGWTAVARGAAAETWRRSVRICENGVVHANTLVLWPRVRGFYWHPRDESILVLCLFLRRPATTIRPDDREDVEALLRRAIVKRAT
jgi:hypothetical protein